MRYKKIYKTNNLNESLDNQEKQVENNSLKDSSNGYSNKVIKSSISKTKNIAKKTYNVLNSTFDKAYNKINNSKTVISNLYLVKKTHWIRMFILKLLSVNPVLKAMALYCVVIFIFAGLLCIKGTQVESFHDSNQNTFFYAFFTTLSTMTAIGIMLNPIPETYTIWGQIVIFILLEFGGIIFSYIVSNVYLSFRSNKGNKINNQLLIQIENGEERINSALTMLKWNIVIIGGLQIIFAISLSLSIFYIPGYEPESTTYFNQSYVGFIPNSVVWQYHNVAGSIWSGVFDSVSALYNAGMSLFGSANVEIYRNGLGIIIQFLLALEFILGGIGFPLFYDLIIKIKMHIRHSKYKLSLYSKLSLNAVFFVTLISSILAYIFAYTDHNSETSIILSTNYDSNGNLNTIYSPWGTDPTASKNWAIFFSMLNTHSAAFSSFNLANLSTGNKWVYIINMFIGCSPSATTGQIKLVLLISVFYFVFNKIKLFKNNDSFKKSITKAMVWNSIVMFLFGILLSILGTIAFYFLYYAVPGTTSTRSENILDSIFLSVSIYSLCGFSYGMSFTSSFDGQIVLTFMVLLSQMMLLISIFVVQKNTYTDDELKKKRLQNAIKKFIKQKNMR